MPHDKKLMVRMQIESNLNAGGHFNILKFKFNKATAIAQ